MTVEVKTGVVCIHIGGKLTCTGEGLFFWMSDRTEGSLPAREASLVVCLTRCHVTVPEVHFYRWLVTSHCLTVAMRCGLSGHLCSIVHAVMRAHRLVIVSEGAVVSAPPL